MSSDIARFYQQCDPAKPLPHGDERYVFPAEGTRGEGDAIAQITNAIRWSDTPLHLLFAGHRGGGKSTELLRLCDALANPPDGETRFFVVYFEADEDDIDVNDADLPDVLLAIIRQVGKALRERVKIELKPTWLNRFLDDLKALLGSQVSFEKVELDAKSGNSRPRSSPVRTSVAGFVKLWSPTSPTSCLPQTSFCKKPHWSSRPAVTPTSW